MTVNDAYKKLVAKYPSINFYKCFEYRTLFVFTVASETNNGPVLQGSFSVNKVTGEVRDFKPFHISINEYRNGKEVRGFKK